MIVRPRLGFWEIFTVRHETVLGQIRRPLLCFGLWSAAVVLIHHLWPGILRGHEPGPYALIGVALSIFYSFRNNACYERWWEGRRQWGQLVLSMRNFARQTRILDNVAPDERPRLLTLAIAFCYALVLHLRPGFRAEAADQWLSSADGDLIRNRPNQPDAVLQIVGKQLADLKDAGSVSDISFQLLDHTVQQFAAVQGACERIRATPVPFAYNQLLRRTTIVFLAVLPFGFVTILGWADILAELIMVYVFLGLDVLGDELEEPFAERPNALPIAALAKVIEIELRAAMGETDLPPMPKPIGFVLA